MRYIFPRKMEFLSLTNCRTFHFNIVVLWFLATVLLVFATEECSFPAIFNLGDSNSDTGGLAASNLATPPVPPYGETYFHMPAGRFSDGRLIIDFIARTFKLPFLSAYLDSLGSNFTHGANFATAASTIVPQTQLLPTGGFSPFDLNVQYLQFLQFKHRSQFIRERGGVFGNLMPQKKYLQKALYTFDIGQNDLGAGFFSNMTIQQVNASIPLIIGNFSTYIKKIYKDIGGKSFWVHNTGPIGCLPYILANLPAEKDNVGCAKPYNEVAQYFNHQLKEAVLQLRKELPFAAITYVDVYAAKYSLYREPQKYGFDHPLLACCGYGGEYNYNGSAFCGETVVIDGTKVLVGSCKDPSIRVNWDGIHYTEAANKYIFDQISTGSFSDPPIPLRMACKRRL